MYLDTSTVRQNGKTYTRYLLRHSYRQAGKVKHRTLANLSHCSPQEIEALRLALRHKGNLSEVTSLKESLSLRQGLSVGAVWLVYEVARQLGIVSALGSSRQGKLAVWQVIARVIEQGSRLSAVRLAASHAACDILDLGKFDEEDLYENLDWLYQHQIPVENHLYKKLHRGHRAELFLYDVTSSYLEGEKNELAAFGYNRDGKRGKRQIVVGLLCDEQGRPLSIEVFSGNTQDAQTLAPQIQKVADRFGGGEVALVGDRGMIKSPQMEDLHNHHFHYITAITKAQIESLLHQGVLQWEWFKPELAEVQTPEGLRYVLRCNPLRAQESHQARQAKYRSLSQAVAKQNCYLQDHPRAKVEVALRKIEELRERLKISKWVGVSSQDRQMALWQNSQALAEVSKLDGCYVLQTDLPEPKAPKELVHERYKDLALVEWAFRCSKTVQLELRPLYVRLADHTRGHALVIMLAYHIIKELASRWQSLNVTVEEGINELATLCTTEVWVKGMASYHQIPQPRQSVQQLLKAASVRLPRILPSKGVVVATKKKLPERRKNL